MLTDVFPLFHLCEKKHPTVHLSDPNVTSEQSSCHTRSNLRIKSIHLPTVSISKLNYRDFWQQGRARLDIRNHFEL